MDTFPTIGQYKADGYKEIPDASKDIVSNTDGGYDITRRRYTRNRKCWAVPYVRITKAEKDTFSTFVTNNGLSGSFYWQHPSSLVTHEVRFSEELPDIIWKDGFYNVTIKIKEV